MQTERKGLQGIWARFPALRRLEWRAARRRILHVQQTTAVDCGAACLAMVLGYHGKHLALEEVRRAVAADRDGTSLAAILAAGI